MQGMLVGIHNNCMTTHLSTLKQRIWTPDEDLKPTVHIQGPAANAAEYLPPM